ncbi:alpha-2-macroglobulin receptor-associated protein [Ceratina calcarata]|uniref:Alpha-2-macroglobulin receptor-associated protein n=1 Tax=Ceratina calcarata TaxID=156304 RepID=A0AAJ7IW23_9HYME|nr:alpha-2-macroglobulin receptor-associated protein [Ceratina calcarata]
MASFGSVFLSIGLFCVLFFRVDRCSAAADEPEHEDPLRRFPNSLRELDKPFRVARLNVLWAKAKNRLTDTKLRSIFSDLKIQDEEEIAYKHFRAEGKDPYGERESRLRSKLIGIMSTYGMLERFEDTEDPVLLHRHRALNDGKNDYLRRDVFKDARLNKLWAEAETAGFTDEELRALKEEFRRHQERVEEYTRLLRDVGTDDPPQNRRSPDRRFAADHGNEIEAEEEEISNDVRSEREPSDHLEKATLLREKHLELKDGYDRLDRLTGKGPNHKRFVEPKVQGLWRVVLEADFSPEERASLRDELMHYEGRLLKLRHYHTEAALEAAHRGKTFDSQRNSTLEHRIKKHARTVEKLHADLEAKIVRRHSEL